MVDTRPLLLLDVDGPLNPFRATKPEGYTMHKLPTAGVTFNVWLNHAAINRLAAEETT